MKFKCFPLSVLVVDVRGRERSMSMRIKMSTGPPPVPALLREELDLPAHPLQVLSNERTQELPVFDEKKRGQDLDPKLLGDLWTLVHVHPKEEDAAVAAPAAGGELLGHELELKQKRHVLECHFMTCFCFFLLDQVGGNAEGLLDSLLISW